MTPARVLAAAATLAAALQDDPIFSYALPDVSARPGALAGYCAAELERAVQRGAAFAAGWAPDGVAVWVPPGAETGSEATREDGPGKMAEAFGAAAYARFGQVVERLEEIHARDAAAPHWYLTLLGVGPSAQGRGVGGTLLRPVLAAADDARLACYTETFNPRSMAFYLRHGFEVVRNEVEPFSRLRYVTLLRPPGT